ncbi:hypothetical protein LJC45_05375 [Alistipes sp. OttesenSCG-928-B03]|nr:hypothetical protein [Alistipes sp. OttesenSCG-928-B03]
MENKITVLSLIGLMSLMLSCSYSKTTKETPFMTIVKLNSAQEFLDFQKAKQYIDINAVFSHSPSTVDAEKEWKELLQFQYKLGQDKKFTNSFNYSRYDFKEIMIDKSNCKVEFIPLESSDRTIVYFLELRGKQWVVIRIDTSSDVFSTSLP